MLSNRIRQLAPPPRPVPLPVVCSAMLGITGMLGAIFLVAGLGFTLVFTGGYRPIDEIRLDRSETTARGTITGLSGTNATENDVPVYEYAFAFTTRRGERAIGRSYVNGEPWSVEDTVTIEYVPDDPRLARIQGARMSEFSPWVLFVLIFPAVGAGFFLSAALSGWRQVILLRYGQVADARILSTRSTGMSVNDVPVLAYSYEIRTGTGEVFEGSARALPNGQVGDEESEPALFLPGNPSRSTLVDAIPLRFPLDVDGLSGRWISAESRLKVVLYFLIWAAAIGLGAYWLWRTFGWM
jgi:hypothetical protein